MHVPCSKCGSSDAGWLFDDGGMFCYACKEFTHAPGGEAIAPMTEKKSKKKKLAFLDVEVGAVAPRGIDQATAEKWGYGYSTFSGRRCQVAQYRDTTGKLVGQKVRFPTDKLTGKKEFLVVGDLKPAGLFGQHLWRDSGKMVVVTEGEIDALSVSQLQGNKWPVVSLPNGAGSAKDALIASSEWLERFDRVVLLFDNDAAGAQAVLESVDALSPGKVHIAKLPLKDANEMLLAHRGPEVIDAIWQAKAYRPDGLVSGDAVWEQVTRADLARSVPFHHRGLQEKTHGLRVGEVTTLVAGTGTGKSTMARELAHHLISAGEKLGIVALEEPVRRSALGLIGIGLNKPLHLLTNEQIMAAGAKAEFEKIKDRVVFYDHFGSLDSENLLSKMRFMAKGERCTFIVLDHISIVVSGMDLEGDERRALDKVMTDLASLAQETNTGIILVSHLKRPQGGVAHEEGRQVSLADLRGSGSIAQLSMNVISLERNQQATGDDDTLSTCRVLKCRHTGLTGVAGYFQYDHETGRQTEAGMFNAVTEGPDGAQQEEAL